METNQPQRTVRKRRQIGAIDGLRALAILAILIYHARPTWLPGGYVGVTVFFVITGYLITSSVERELEKEGSLDWPNFMFRRITRLLPAMLAVVGVTAILVLVFSPSLIAKMKTDAIPAVLFFENIWYIVHEVSYFAAAGLPSPLTHFWFVGVTMQFYLFWPLVMAIVHRFTDSRTVKAIVAVILIVASTVAMFLLYDPMADSSRVYYGPDTRLAELLVGAVVALAAPKPQAKRSSRHSSQADGRSSRRRKEERPPQANPVLDIAGAACLVFLAVLCFVINGYSSFPYRGGFLLMAIATGVILLAVTQPASMLGKVLGCPPMAVAGKRGFGVYLWHYPLLLVMNPATRTTELPWWGWIVEFVIIIAVAELSYRIFEAVPAPKPPRGARINPMASFLDQGITALALELVGILAIAVLFVVPVDAEAAAGVPGVDAENAAQTTPVIREQEAIDPTEGHTVYNPKGTYFDGTAFGDAWSIINDMYIEVDPETGVCNARVILIGDSVPAGAINQFYEIFPNGYIDAEVGRQIYVADDVYLQAVANGVEGEFVVFSSGDNGVATEEQVLDLINCVGEGKRVYLVTTRVPLALQDLNNALFYEIASRYDNVEVIDWYAYSAGHDEYFWADGTHLRPEGAEAYVTMVREAIAGR